MSAQKTTKKHPHAGRNTEDEQGVYADVYRLLIAGMIASNVFFLIGLVLALLHPQYFPLSPAWIRQQYHWSVLRRSLAGGDPEAFAMIATVLLILTPVARVVVSIYAFFLNREFKFVGVTSLVFLVILVTVALGFLGLR